MRLHKTGVLVLALIAGPAQATERHWINVVDQNHQLWAIDGKSLRRNPPNTVVYWTKNTFAPDQRQDGVAYRLAKVQANCDDLSFTILNFFRYRDDGTIISSSLVPDHSNAPPGSIMGAIITTVCQATK
jgi:hypothetical protein